MSPDAIAIRVEVAKVVGKPVISASDFYETYPTRLAQKVALVNQLHSMLQTVAYAVDHFCETITVDKDGKPVLCAICSEPLSQPMTVLECSHAFHEPCWDEYKRLHGTVEAMCPNCNYKVVKEADVDMMAQIVLYEDEPLKQAPSAQSSSKPT